MVCVSLGVFPLVWVLLYKRRSSHNLLRGPLYESVCVMDQHDVHSIHRAQPSTSTLPSLRTSFWKNVKCEEEEILSNFSFLLIFPIFFHHLNLFVFERD